MQSGLNEEVKKAEDIVGHDGYSDLKNSDLYRDLEPGDIIMHRDTTGSAVSHAIRELTHSPYNHCSMAIEWKDANGNWHMMETSADACGPQFSDHSFAGYNGQKRPWWNEQGRSDVCVFRPSESFKRAGFTRKNLLLAFGAIMSGRTNFKGGELKGGGWEWKGFWNGGWQWNEEYVEQSTHAYADTNKDGYISNAEAAANRPTYGYGDLVQGEGAWSDYVDRAIEWGIKETTGADIKIDGTSGLLDILYYGEEFRKAKSVEERKCLMDMAADNSYICSELIARIYQMCGVNLIDEALIATVTPVELIMNGSFEYVGNYVNGTRQNTGAEMIQRFKERNNAPGMSYEEMSASPLGRVVTKATGVSDLGDLYWKEVEVTRERQVERKTLAFTYDKDGDGDVDENDYTRSGNMHVRLSDGTRVKKYKMKNNGSYWDYTGPWWRRKWFKVNRPKTKVIRSEFTDLMKQQYWKTDMVTEKYTVLVPGGLTGDFERALGMHGDEQVKFFPVVQNLPSQKGK